jgi:KUP system potassium uptake protein
MKLFDGGWFPLLIGGIDVHADVDLERRGASLLNGQVARRLRSTCPAFLEAVFVSPPARVDGTAVFLTAEPGTVPNALLHNLKHNKVLHAPEPVRHGAPP